MSDSHLEVRGPYRATFVCFACRRGFKWPHEPAPGQRTYRQHTRSPEWALVERLLSGLDVDADELPECPGCHGPVLYIHPTRRPPPARNTRAWRQLEHELDLAAKRRSVRRR